MDIKLLRVFLRKLQLSYEIAKRFLIVLFRKKKDISLLHLDYQESHLFDSSYVIVRYRFRNALWYNFNNQNTTENTVKIFNLKATGNIINLTVYGWFKKKQYRIELIPTNSLITSNFKTAFSKLNTVLLPADIPENFYSAISITPQTIITEIPKIKIHNKLIFNKHLPYNLKDFI